MKATNKIGLVLVILILVSLVSTLLFGLQVRSPMTIPLDKVVFGMRAAIQELPGTMLMENSGNILFAWASGGDSWSFASIMGPGATNIASVPVGRCKDCFSFSKLVSTLKTFGWKEITADVVPSSIRDMLIAQSFTQALYAVASKGWFTLWALPVGILDNAGFQPVQWSE